MAGIIRDILSFAWKLMYAFLASTFSENYVLFLHMLT